MCVLNDSPSLLCRGSGHPLDALPAYPVRPGSQSPVSRPQHSLFRQERAASCKTAALAESDGSEARINSHDIRAKTTLMTVAELAGHFRQRELLDSNMRITYCTKKRMPASRRNGLCRAGNRMHCSTSRPEKWSCGWRVCNAHEPRARSVYSLGEFLRRGIRARCSV